MNDENISNIRLLREIEKYPCLYNYNLTEYSLRETTEKIWNEIAEKFSKTPDECKSRWKNLRGSLTRNLAQKLKRTGKVPKTFYLTKHMQFVIPFAKSKHGYTYDALSNEKVSKEERESDTGCDDNSNNMEDGSKDSWDSMEVKDSIEFFDENIEECNEASELQKTNMASKSSPVPTTSSVLPTKEPLDLKVEQPITMEHNDADKHFLLSLLPHLHCLTLAEKLQFQIKTLNIINEIMNAKEKG